MVRAFGKLIAPYARRISLMIGRGIVRMVDDSGALQRVQLTVLEGETRSALERLGEYGLASNPPAGAEAVIASVTGSRDHAVIIAVEHRRYRLKALQSGEVAIYDDLGQKIHLTREGIVIESGVIKSIGHSIIEGHAQVKTGASGTFVDKTGKVILVRNGIVVGING